MTVGLKPTFAPVPLRAYRDKTLTALDLRVLAAIAVHDRFNSNGQACWASNERLANVGGCHVKSVPRSIARLIGAGYLRDLGAKPGSQRSRSRFLTVIYTEADAQSLDRPAAPCEAVEAAPALPVEAPVRAPPPPRWARVGGRRNPVRAAQPKRTLRQVLDEAAAEADAALPMDAPVKASPPPRSQPAGGIEGNRPVTQREQGRNSAEAEAGFRTLSGAPIAPPQPLIAARRGKADAERWLAERLASQHGGDLSIGYALLDSLSDQRSRGGR